MIAQNEFFSLNRNISLHALFSSQVKIWFDEKAALRMNGKRRGLQLRVSQEFCIFKSLILYCSRDEFSCMVKYTLYVLISTLHPQFIDKLCISFLLILGIIDHACQEPSDPEYLLWDLSLTCHTSFLARLFSRVSARLFSSWVHGFSRLLCLK